MLRNTSRPNRLFSRVPILASFGIVAVPLIVALGSLSPGRDAPEGMPDESRSRVVTEVREFLERYLSVIETEDADAIRALFVSDDRFAWYTDGALAYASPDEVVAGRLAYRGVRFETTFEEVRIVPLNATLASARAKFVTRLTIPNAEDHQFGGVITWLVEKGENGEGSDTRWRVLLGHTSTPGGPPSDKRR